MERLFLFWNKLSMVSRNHRYGVWTFLVWNIFDTQHSVGENLGQFGQSSHRHNARHLTHVAFSGQKNILSKITTIDGTEKKRRENKST